MESTIKEIVSVFIKVPADQIGPSTPVGRTAVKSSILLHRMYAKLSEQGLRVENYAEIQSFGDLQRHANGGAAPFPAPADGQAAPVAISAPVLAETSGGGIGVDMEEIAALPRTHDFRKESFYIENFTAGEIAYCILQADPYASFTGLFAAKEAIVKAADGRYSHRPFHTIEIGHSPDGKPLHDGWHLSISHAGNMAVAVASPLRQQEPVVRDEIGGAAQPARRSASAGGRLVWIALLISLVAIVLVLQQRYR